MDHTDIVSVERVIPAPAAEIFALIADPHRHQEFDGSGTVRDAKDVPDTLEARLHVRHEHADRCCPTRW